MVPMSWTGASRSASAAAVAAVAAVAACSPFGGGVFTCETSAQCSPDGTCELDGLCSFPDALCMSGRRYGSAAGELSGTCVGEEPQPPDAPEAADARPDAMPGAPDAPIDAMQVAPFCDPADTTLRLCLAFEGNATDGSSFANNPATASLTFVTGQVEMGVQLTAQSRIDVPEVASLDNAHLTMEAWINPSQIPATGRVGIADDNGEWGFFLQPGGILRCTPAPTVSTVGVITQNTWTHVACTHDGTTLAIWVNGSLAASIAAGGNIGTGGTNGTSIAGDNPPPNDRFLGVMDQVRVFSEARSPAQICAAAGMTTCP
jgi:hypothetical protein